VNEMQVEKKCFVCVLKEKRENANVLVIFIVQKFKKLPKMVKKWSKNG
jgi:hypothetical protein